MSNERQSTLLATCSLLFLVSLGCDHATLSKDSLNLISINSSLKLEAPRLQWSYHMILTDNHEFGGKPIGVCVGGSDVATLQAWMNPAADNEAYRLQSVQSIQQGSCPAALMVNGSTWSAHNVCCSQIEMRGESLVHASGLVPYRLNPSIGLDCNLTVFSDTSQNLDGICGPAH